MFNFIIIHIQIGADEKFRFQANFKFNNFQIWLLDYLNNYTLYKNAEDVFRIVAKTCNFILRKRNEVLYCK
jgi:hypothetical protein